MRINITILAIILTLISMFLKVQDIITWDWFYVLLPLYIIIGIWAFVFLCVLIIGIGLIYNIVKGMKEKDKK